MLHNLGNWYMLHMAKFVATYLSRHTVVGLRRVGHIH